LHLNLRTCATLKVKNNLKILLKTNKNQKVIELKFIHVLSFNVAFIIINLGISAGFIFKKFGKSVIYNKKNGTF